MPANDNELDPAKALRAEILNRIDRAVSRCIATYGQPIEPVDKEHDWLNELDDKLLDALTYSMAERIRRRIQTHEYLRLIGEQANTIKRLQLEVSWLRRISPLIDPFTVSPMKAGEDWAHSLKVGDPFDGTEPASRRYYDNPHDQHAFSEAALAITIFWRIEIDFPGGPITSIVKPASK